MKILIRILHLCIRLQETHLSPEKPYKRFGGVAVIIQNGCKYNTSPLNSTLQAMAIEAFIPSKILICSIYLPNDSWDITEIENFVSQLPYPSILMGAFNAHNTLWSSSEGRDLGNWLENFREIMLLNDGSKNRLNEKGIIFTAIDHC